VFAPFWCADEEASVPKFAVPIQLVFKNHVIDVHSVQVKLDGVIVGITSADLLLVKKGNNGEIAGADMVVRFMPTTAMYSIEGSAFKARLMTAFRLSLNRFHVYLAFQALDKSELGKLKRHIAELS
jgi:hypothetical protein